MVEPDLDRKAQRQTGKRMRAFVQQKGEDQNEEEAKAELNHQHPLGVLLR